MKHDEILQAAKVERDRIVTEVMLSHTEDVDGFSYRWFARRIADEVAAIIEKRTIERCAQEIEWEDDVARPGSFYASEIRKPGEQ